MFCTKKSRTLFYIGNFNKKTCICVYFQYRAFTVDAASAVVGQEEGVKLDSGRKQYRKKRRTKIESAAVVAKNKLFFGSKRVFIWRMRTNTTTRTVRRVVSGPFKKVRLNARKLLKSRRADSAKRGGASGGSSFSFYRGVVVRRLENSAVQQKNAREAFTGGANTKYFDLNSISSDSYPNKLSRFSSYAVGQAHDDRYRSSVFREKMVNSGSVLWVIAIKTSRNNVFVTASNVQNGHLVYTSSGRASGQRFRPGRTPRRIREMLVPIFVKAVSEGAAIKTINFLGASRYVSRVIDGVRRRRIPVWRIVIKRIQPHNGCRRRKARRK